MPRVEIIAEQAEEDVITVSVEATRATTVQELMNVAATSICDIQKIQDGKRAEYLKKIGD